MAQICPTQKWVKHSLTVPGQGVIKRPRVGTLTVNDSAATWLIAEGYADVVGEGVAPSPANLVAEPKKGQPEPAPMLEQPPAATEAEVSVVIEPPTTASEPPALPATDEANWQSQALDFLNSTPAENISETLKGFGPQTVEKLQSAKPLTFELLNSLLTNAQLKALQAHFSP